jgi:hypothetical protein
VVWTFSARARAAPRYEKAIDYVGRNPAKAGKKRQDWNFVREAREAQRDARRKRRG